ncbi:respiratory burst oxidase homolog protein B-like [Typha angustifolia]|uniref:respiratory burst oxidase homolog protein B-like n=1 Tax=Typha angustifolia TaxID=59011 RepID=UPI003C2E96C1
MAYNGNLGPLGNPGSVFEDPESKNSSKRSTRFKDKDEYMEITLNVREDGVTIQNSRGKDQEMALLANLDRPTPSLSTSLSSKLKQVGSELRRMTSSKKPEVRPAPRLDRTMTGAARALKGLQFVTHNMVTQGWTEVEKRFDKLAVDGFLLRSRFGQCIGMLGSEEFAGQVFDSLARRRGITAAVLTKDQLKEFWQQLSDPGFDARLQTFFDMVDKNLDGQITEEEVKEIITLSASANKLTKILDRVDEYTALIMEELDPEHLGYIDIKNLEMLLLEPQAPAAKLTSNTSNLSQLISQKLVPTKDSNPIRRCCRRISYFMEDNWKRVWVMALWLGICAGLFTWKFIAYKRHVIFEVMSYCVCVAKGGAETTKLNMAIILLPICRNTITWLRSKTRLGAIVPFNDSLNFHKVIAWGIAVGVALHVVPHLTCDFPLLLHATDEEYEPLKRFFGDKRPPNYWWFVKGVEGVTGLILLILMIIAYTFAQPYFRRNKLDPASPFYRFAGFNTFWYSHHLFIIVYIAFVVHGVCLYINRTWYKKTTWMYLAIPLTLYVGERVLRAFRSGYKSVRILKAVLYPGNVYAVYMDRPHGFKYKSGQYMFVNCPEISLFEWHPFTITSAPGEKNLSMHIRTRGDWTTQLRANFMEVCMPPISAQPSNSQSDMIMTSNETSKFPKLLIDGPYGAPAQDYWKYDVLLLIGLGIGATPLISIVKDVLDNTQMQKEGLMSPEDLRRNGKGKRKTFMTQRAYFYWVTREEGSFEWFRNVMTEVEEKDKEQVIELHNHCTSVYAEGDARSALIIMLQSLNQAKHGVDIVTGTRVKTHFARPNWRNVFKHVAVHHENQRVGVFYCGDQTLVPELRRLASDFSHKTNTKFVFHKENF